MLIELHNCLDTLLKYENENDCRELISEFINNKCKINSDIIRFLLSKNEVIPAVEHYKLLNNKAHKIIHDIMVCNGMEVFVYIKIATSLITQATLTLQHQFKNNIKGANDFITCTRLRELSKALSIYFETGIYDNLVKEVNLIREDIKIIVDL